MALASRQSLQQPLGLPQISGIESLAEPGIDLSQQLASLLSPAALLPQPTQAQCRPQLPGFGLLVTGQGQRLPKARLRRGNVYMRMRGELGAIYDDHLLPPYFRPAPSLRRRRGASP
jgi:hypothetical protein